MNKIVKTLAITLTIMGSLISGAQAASKYTAYNADLKIMYDTEYKKGESMSNASMNTLIFDNVKDAKYIDAIKTMDLTQFKDENALMNDTFGRLNSEWYVYDEGTTGNSYDYTNRNIKLLRNIKTNEIVLLKVNAKPEDVYWRQTQFCYNPESNDIIIYYRTGYNKELNSVIFAGKANDAQISNYTLNTWDRNYGCDSKGNILKTIEITL